MKRLIASLALLVTLLPMTATATPAPVNTAIGDVSWEARFGRPPTAWDNDRERVHVHLEYVVRLLGSEPAPSPNLEASRAANLDRLRHYIARGVFPYNDDHPDPRRPTFVDQAGTRCAVGDLAEAELGAERILAINRRHKYALLPDMDDSAILDWAAGSGFTTFELAMIQPHYGSMKRRRTGAVLVSTPYRSAHRSWQDNLQLLADDCVWPIAHMGEKTFEQQVKDKGTPAGAPTTATLTLHFTPRKAINGFDVRVGDGSWPDLDRCISGHAALTGAPADTRTVIVANAVHKGRRQVSRFTMGQIEEAVVLRANHCVSQSAARAGNHGYHPKPHKLRLTLEMRSLERPSITSEDPSDAETLTCLASATERIAADRLLGPSVYTMELHVLVACDQPGQSCTEFIGKPGREPAYNPLR